MPQNAKMTTPEGLLVSSDFISTDQEKDIINWLDRQQWSNQLSRRTQHYGYNYDYTTGALSKTKDLSGPLLEISNYLKQIGIINAEQCIVNEYFRDQGIAPHIDRNSFGPVIVGISIGDDTVMKFEKENQVFECFLPARSLLVMKGPSRNFWKHSISKGTTFKNDKGENVIKPKNYRRISLTFRELSK